MWTGGAPGSWTWMVTTSITVFSFAGETRIESEIINGVVTDLNVMTRRGRFRHRLTVLTNNQPTRLAAQSRGFSAIFVAGHAIVRSLAGEVWIWDYDTILLSVANETVRLLPMTW